MPRGGSRPGAGRKRKPLSLHKLQGTLRPDRHGEPATAVVLSMPARTNGSDWRPTEVETAALSLRAQLWLQAVLSLYQLDAVEGQALLECMRVLSRIEVLEREDGLTTAAALVRERKLFLSMWTSLRIVK